MFTGNDPQAFPETEAWYKKWNSFFAIFLQCIDRRTGSFLHFPFSAGALEQPAKTMTILLTIQDEYFKFLEQSMKRK